MQAKRWTYKRHILDIDVVIECGKAIAYHNVTKPDGTSVAAPIRESDDSKETLENWVDLRYPSAYYIDGEHYGNWDEKTTDMMFALRMHGNDFAKSNYNFGTLHISSMMHAFSELSIREKTNLMQVSSAVKQYRKNTKEASKEYSKSVNDLKERIQEIANH